MKIDYSIDPADAKALEDALKALPVGLQHACYGAGFKSTGQHVARQARQKAPVGEGIPVTRGGKVRKRLFESIRVVLIPWHFGGVKVPRSASIVVAEQPHAWLAEHGVRGPHKGREPQPYLMPALNAKTGNLSAFRKGAGRAFGRVVRQINRNKLSKSTARALRLST